MSRRRCPDLEQRGKCAVKHFRFELRSKRRIHQTPGPAHIVACVPGCARCRTRMSDLAGQLERRRPWLVAEFSLLKPELVVILGATARGAPKWADLLYRCGCAPVGPGLLPARPAPPALDAGSRAGRSGRRYAR